MKRFIPVFIVIIIVLIVSYVIAPLFLRSKNQTFTSNAQLVADVAREAVRTVKSTLNSEDPCLEPFHYAIGTVDPRFSIDRETLMADMLRAESIWEDAARKDILQYDEQATFKVNLLFDERQQRTIESRKLEQKLDTVQTLQEGISKEYDVLSSQYDKKEASYESDVKKYKRFVDAYEKQVKYWNDRGGAPEDEYRKLQQTQDDAEAMADDIEQKRKDVNVLAGQLNNLAKREKKAVESYNKEIETYESVYGSEQAFDQGVYTGQEINVYQFGDERELVLVLAHEFGHALGMSHVENAQSIMYYLMSKQNLDHTVPSVEDIQALRNSCLP